MRHLLRVMLNIIKQCRKEIEEFPEEIRGDLADAVVRLESGHMLSMPLSRPTQNIELAKRRLKEVL